MDGTRFDRITRALGQATTRRRGAAVLLGGVGAGVGAVVAGAGKRQAGSHDPDQEPEAERPAAEDDRHPKPGDGAGRETRQPAGRRLRPKGACGDGSGKDNACTKHAQCCTGFCEPRKTGVGRCRCIKKGESCTTRQTCCGGYACVGKVCALPSTPTPTPTATPNPVRVWTNQTTFGTIGSGASQFNGPYGVFVSADGLTAWVADRDNNRVSVWTRPNTTTNATAWSNQTTFGSAGSGPSELYGLHNVFVSTDGLTAYVADAYNHRISIWTRPNTTTNATAWSNQTTFGSNGSGPSGFSFPYSVVVSTDGLTAWVADISNNRISIWTRPNTTTNATAWSNQTTFGSAGSGSSEFYNPTGVFVSADGLTAWVADSYNNRISIWTRPDRTTNATAWSNQTTFGSTGSGPSEFNVPPGVFASADGRTAWVADFSNGRISVWTGA